MPCTSLSSTKVVGIAACRPYIIRKSDQAKYYKISPSGHPISADDPGCYIPFALTEFGRMSLWKDQSNFKSFAEETRKDKKLSELLGQEKLQVLAKSLDYQPSSAINPFMQPGHIGAQPHSMPSAVNAFTSIIMPRLNIG